MLGKWCSCSEKNGRIEVLLRRLRIEPTCLTHRFLLCGDEPPQCEHRGEAVTGLHTIYVCPSLDKLRCKCFSHFYGNRIPLHPALLQRKESLIVHELSVKFFKEANLLYFFRSFSNIVNVISVSRIAVSVTSAP